MLSNQQLFKNGKNSDNMIFTHDYDTIIPTSTSTSTLAIAIGAGTTAAAITSTTNTTTTTTTTTTHNNNNNTQLDVVRETDDEYENNNISSNNNNNNNNNTNSGFNRQINMEKPIVLDSLPISLTLKNFDLNYKIVTSLGTGSFGTVQLCKKMVNNNNNINDNDNTTTTNNNNSYDHINQRGYDFTNTMLNHDNLNINNNYHNNLNQVVAIKTMMTRLDYLSDYSRVRELKFIFKIPSNDHLLTIYDCFIDDFFYKLHITMEVMDQNLYQLIKYRNLHKRYFSLATLKSISSQVLSGLYHIHENQFFHRDLKPENILVSFSSKYYSKEYLQQEDGFKDNYVVKIADYGLSRQVVCSTTPMSNDKFTAYVSTRWYRSPEILLRNKYYSKPVDIWAFGCVMMEICTFKPLFPGNDELDQIWKILQMLGTPFLSMENQINNYFPHGGVWEHSIVLLKKLGLNFPYIQGYDIEYQISNPHLQKFCDVIKKCLIWNPLQRITVEQICELPYFYNTKPFENHLNVLKNREMHESINSCYMNNSSSGTTPAAAAAHSNSGRYILNQSSLFNGLPSSNIKSKSIPIQKPVERIAGDENIEHNQNVLDSFIDLYNNHTVAMCSNAKSFEPPPIPLPQQQLQYSPIKESHRSNNSITNMDNTSGNNNNIINNNDNNNTNNNNNNYSPNNNSNYTLLRPISVAEENVIQEKEEHSGFYILNPRHKMKHTTPNDIIVDNFNTSGRVQDYIDKELNLDIPFPLDSSM